MVGPQLVFLRESHGTNAPVVFVAEFFSQQNKVFGKILSALFIFLIITSTSIFSKFSVHFVTRRFKLIYLPRQNDPQPPLCPPPSSFLSRTFELANQFNRAVGRSEKIIGADRLFKIQGSRIVSGSQLY